MGRRSTLLAVYGPNSRFRPIRVLRDTEKLISPFSVPLPSRRPSPAPPASTVVFLGAPHCLAAPDPCTGQKGLCGLIRPTFRRKQWGTRPPPLPDNLVILILLRNCKSRQRLVSVGLANMTPRRLAWQIFKEDHLKERFHAPSLLVSFLGEDETSSKELEDERKKKNRHRMRAFFFFLSKTAESGKRSVSKIRQGHACTAASRHRVGPHVNGTVIAQYYGSISTWVCMAPNVHSPWKPRYCLTNYICQRERDASDKRLSFPSSSKSHKCTGSPCYR